MADQHRRVVWTPNAWEMLDEACAYIAQGSPRAARRLLTRALDAAASLAETSERGRMVPELQQATIRELIVGKYRLMYELFDDRVEVLGFLYGARDFSRWHRQERE